LSRATDLKLLVGERGAGGGSGVGADSPVGSDVIGDDLSDWVLATAPRAVAYATSLLRNRERAEDVVQDCYCRLLAKAGTYDLPRDGLKLLLTAISNACINFKARRKFAYSLFSDPERQQGPLSIIDRSVTSPDEQVMNQELELLIGRGLERLPVAQRAALELKSLGHSTLEIAEILGTKSSHVGVLIHRARKAMERHLSSYFNGGGS
jgi:RNA polymerase sigma factor (sigma-70 family)